MPNKPGLSRDRRIILYSAVALLLVAIGIYHLLSPDRSPQPGAPPAESRTSSDTNEARQSPFTVAGRRTRPRRDGGGIRAQSVVRHFCRYAFAASLQPSHRKGSVLSTVAHGAESPRHPRASRASLAERTGAPEANGARAMRRLHTRPAPVPVERRALDAHGPRIGRRHGPPPRDRVTCSRSSRSPAGSPGVRSRDAAEPEQAPFHRWMRAFLDGFARRCYRCC